MKRCVFVLLVFAGFLPLTSCTHVNETLNPNIVGDYFPLQTGKYITYDLDSVNYPNFGARPVTTHYQVMYYTDSTLLDNLGRISYRIIRYIRSDSTQAWTSDNTFMATNTGNSIEWVENNL